VCCEIGQGTVLSLTALTSAVRLEGRAVMFLSYCAFLCPVRAPSSTCECPETDPSFSAWCRVSWRICSCLSSLASENRLCMLSNCTVMSRDSSKLLLAAAQICSDALTSCSICFRSESRDPIFECNIAISRPDQVGFGKKTELSCFKCSTAFMAE
jgi:hypothetical protein